MLPFEGLQLLQLFLEAARGCGFRVYRGLGLSGFRVWGFGGYKGLGLTGFRV